ncbi:RNA methyltransferase [Psychrobacter frigidicola]|uniref:RNA methyltransferase n=1 Tax=Psychrobacter frigidicola TaxID=45611 RepID=A0A5C7A5A8_9GAMM|nr:RNA methyltransferase [Psychrobacter frigidicola]TXD98601.1 RNA methyltransferase [Psychrobacter frigidicola]
MSCSTATVTDYLSCLQVVMVNTTLPANIGSAARAMHTMGLSRLTVVNPKHPIDETSIAHAAGGSELLSAALIAPTLEAAIADCQLVFAASSRSRHLPRPVVTPTQAAKIMLDFIDGQLAISQEAASNTQTLDDNRPPTNIAILFGREDRGLTNEELAYADYHIQIDANPAYPVLNVASAVQVIGSFIFAYAQNHHNAVNNKNDEDKKAIDKLNDTDESTGIASALTTSAAPHLLDTYLRQQWDEPAITQQQLQQLIQRTTDLMIQRSLADSTQLKSLPSRLSRLGSRLQLDQKEYQLLSALIAKILKD